MMVYNIEEIYTVEPPVQKEGDVNTFLGWLKSSKNDSFGKRTVIRKQQGLIDSFIQNDPKIQPVKGALQNVSVAESAPAAQPKARSIVSETLAKIYHQQKKYNLAIETYETLGLVYPEKSAYFARLIDKIEKEQENK